MVYSPKYYTQIKGSLCVRLDLLKSKRVRGCCSEERTFRRTRLDFGLPPRPKSSMVVDVHGPKATPVPNGVKE